MRTCDAFRHVQHACCVTCLTAWTFCESGMHCTRVLYFARLVNSLYHDCTVHASCSLPCCLPAYIMTALGTRLALCDAVYQLTAWLHFARVLHFAVLFTSLHHDCNWHASCTMPFLFTSLYHDCNWHASCTLSHCLPACTTTAFATRLALCQVVLTACTTSALCKPVTLDSTISHST